MSDNPIAYVLLDSFVVPKMTALAEALRERHPELPVELLHPAGSPVIRCGDQEVVVMSMPAPIGAGHGMWSRATVIWPEAKAVAARHQGHVIVSTLSRERQLPAIRITTAVVGALIAATPECCAVVWSDQVARSAKLWLAESCRTFAAFPDYPFTLWLDVLPFRSGDLIGAATKGLAAFVGREIEFEAAKLDLRAVIDNVAGLAVYLVEHGAVIKDGDVFGGADEPGRFRVRYANSTRFPGLPVFFCGEPLAS